MLQSKSPVVAALTYLGAIPFVFGALLLLLNIKIIPFLGATTFIITAYGLVIASFMAGSHWGQQIATNDEQSRSVYLITNLMALALWFEYLVGSLAAYVGLLIVVFILSLWLDYLSYQKKKINSSYMQLRWRITSVVVLSLILVEYCIT